MSVVDINQKVISIKDIIVNNARVDRELRHSLLRELYKTTHTQPDREGPAVRALNDLAESFSRYAGNQQTAFDNGAVASGPAVGDSSQAARLVERAIVQVLGRSAGRDPANFVTVLNGVFPTATDGRQIVAVPTRSVVKLEVNDLNGGLPGMVGQLSARQANLYRAASLIVDDALRVLAGLQPFSPLADRDQVEALRSLIANLFRELLSEFGRVDEPRDPRVTAYLNLLEQNLFVLGRRAHLNEDKIKPVNVYDESMIAGLRLLKDYNEHLRVLWREYESYEDSRTYFSLSEQVERAAIMLPVVATTNAEFEAALDSVGFLPAERRSLASNFKLLAAFLVQEGRLKQADLTVFDLTDWLERFASLEGPSMLSSAGQYGLDFVTDQANDLFFVIAPIVGHMHTTRLNGSSSRSRLEQVLVNERVIWSLDNLLNQLNGLADLAAPAGEALA